MDGPLWAGLDLGETETRVCVIDGAGVSVLEETCASSPDELETCLGPYRSRLNAVGVEAGSIIHLMRSLRARGYPIVAFDARQTKRFIAIRRHKTDAIDARGIADVARLGTGVVSQVLIKSISTQQLRTQLSLRGNLVRQRVAIEALIQSCICLYGGQRPRIGTRTKFRDEVLAEIQRIEASGEVAIGEEVLPLVDLWARMTNYLDRLDRKLAGMANDNAICRRLMEIPGVGPITALAFFSTIEDPRRFAKVAEVGSYLGLAPRLHQSGTRSSTRGITRMGDRRTRSYLVTAATTLLRASTRETDLKRWGLSLRARIGGPKARIAVARKLSVVMLSVWRSGQDFTPWPRGMPTAADPVS